MSAADLKKVVAGMSREDVLKLGPPASRGTMFDDGHLLVLREHTDSSQHRRVGDRAEDIVAPEPPVEGDRLREFGRVRAGSAGNNATASARVKKRLSQTASRSSKSRG